MNRTQMDRKQIIYNYVELINTPDDLTDVLHTYLKLSEDDVDNLLHARITSATGNNGNAPLLLIDDCIDILNNMILG